MTIIKLDAIDSTNNFLKELIKKQEVENFTVVVANAQTNGRGQMGTLWQTEEGKNLIMSILLKDLTVQVEGIFLLNAMISVAVVEAISSFLIPNLSIKWPNDIMSANKKIAGILIENSIKPDNSILSVVGIGLNVNQTQFVDLPHASSLLLQTGQFFSIELVRDKIIERVRQLSAYVVNQEGDHIWDLYHKYLFKKNKPMVFEDNEENRFMGMIDSVTRNGLLQVVLENDEIRYFSIKEIKMLY